MGKTGQASTVSHLALIFMRLLSLLPLRGLQLMGAALGRGFTLVPCRRRSTTITNIDLCFPEHTPGWRRQLVRNSLIETSKGLLETSALWLWPGERALKLIRETPGAEHLQSAYEQGKGVILALPHLGMWEIIGLHVSSRYPMTSLYRPPPMAGMDKVMRQGRERLGAQLVPTDSGGVRALYKALDEGRVLAILPDQDPSAGSGVFAPFFGTQANTMVLLSRLAQKTGAPVLFVYAERLPAGQGYRIHFKPGAAAIGARDMQASVEAVNAGVEACVRECPEQYLWCYKRFRTRPEGETKLYRR